MTSAGERGGVLLVTLVALIVIGGWVATGVLLGWHDAQLGRHVLDAQRVAGTATREALEVVEAWPRPLRFLPIGDSVRLSDRAAIHRTGGRLFLLEVEVSEDPGQRVRLLARLQNDSAPIHAALSTPGRSITPRIALDGGDRAPAAWAGCGPAQAGASLDTLGREARRRLLERLARHADVVVAQPAAGAGVLVVPALTAEHRCNRGLWSNWGEPHRGTAFTACHEYRPVILLRGPARIGGGRGQGVLLVTGDLELRGGFAFAGAVVVDGMLRVGPGGATIAGAVFAQGAERSENDLGASASIVYSACAAGRALAGISGAAPLPERAWMPRY